MKTGFEKFQEYKFELQKLDEELIVVSTLFGHTDDVRALRSILSTFKKLSTENRKLLSTISGRLYENQHTNSPESVQNDFKTRVEKLLINK